MADPTPPPTPSDTGSPPQGDPVARPINMPLRIALIVVAVIGATGSAWYYRNGVATAKPEPAKVEFTPSSDKDQIQKNLELKIGEMVASLFESPLKEITQDNVAKIEQLIKPYPQATLDEKASSYQNTKETGEIFQLIYQTPDTPDQVLEWYQKEWAKDYLTIHKHVSGLAGYTLEIRVPGLHVERDLLIVAVPDKITKESTTQIWVTVRNTLLSGEGST